MGFRWKMRAARRVAVPTQKEAFVIQGLERQRSGGIYPSCNSYLRKVKIAAWVDPSTRCDMVTWSELFQFGMFLVAVIALVFQVNNKEK